MRLSDLAGKEIINISNGDKLGVIGDSELIINETTGKIEAVLVPQNQGFWRFTDSKKYITIPWKTIKKVGAEVIVIDLEGDLGENNKPRYIEL